MYSIKNYEYDCTKKCKSPIHGDKITSAITKRALDDEILSRFIAKVCRNFACVADSEGRTALHMASNLNRHQIVDFLLTNSANINLKDSESGQTALHRAIYYGAINCAVLLLKNGAGLDLYDFDFKNPLQYCLSVKAKESETETFTWGSNSHYNLGLDSDQSSQIPKCVEFFRRQSISISEIALSSYHCLFLTTDNDLFSVGHGIGGRLGSGHENTVVQPQKVAIPFKKPDERIISISVAKSHSLVLTDQDNIYACGLNSCGQLGVKGNVDKSCEFVDLNCPDFVDQKLKKVFAFDHHSIAFGSRGIFVWGKNVGQMGVRSKESVIKSPQQVFSPGQKILLLDACNTGMAFYTDNKLLHVFSNFKMRFIKTPNLDSIINICIGDATSLKLLVLTDSYQLFLWEEENQKYTKCFFPACRHLNIDQMSWCSGRMLFRCDGDLFISTTINVINFTETDDGNEYQEIYSTKKDICHSNRIKIGLQRIPYINRVLNFWTDYSGSNFGLIRDSPKNYLKIPQIKDAPYNLSVLFDEMFEDDLIHDIVFHVEHRSFPAHRFVIMSRGGEGLKQIVSETVSKDCYLNIDGLTAVAFDIIMKILYLNYVITDKDVQKLKDSYQNIGEEHGSLGPFTKLMKDLGMGSYIYKMKKTLPLMSLNRSMYPELYDVTIKCANGRELRAHKCVLVSRLKYFNMMFNSSWLETTEVNFQTIPLEYAELVIDYLYDSSSSRILSKKYTESFVFNMIALTDQLFIESLREIFEVHILRRLTLKRCAELLELSVMYNCSTLKQHVSNFICLNLAELLELRLLESLDMDCLSEIATRYQEMFPEIGYRQIVPSPAVDEDFVRSFVRDFKLDVDTKPVKTATNNKVKEAKIGTKTKVDYEKLGKLSLMKDDQNDKEESVQRAAKSNGVIDSDTVKVAQELGQKSQSLWTKVDKKTDSKKKILLNANEILGNEKKIAEKFTNLKVALNGDSPAKEEKTDQGRDREPPTTPSNSAARLSFADFFSPPNHQLSAEKLSQKQRKRLVRFSECEAVSVAPATPTSSLASPKENAWNLPVAASPIQAVDLSFRNNGSPKTNSLPSNQPLTSSASLTNATGMNFETILKDEKREKEYFDKLKSKSLNLTQMEDMAITELRSFYNVDNVFDELILIERNVRQQTSFNFSQWGKEGFKNSM